MGSTEAVASISEVSTSLHIRELAGKTFNFLFSQLQSCEAGNCPYLFERQSHSSVL